MYKLWLYFLIVTMSLQPTEVKKVLIGGPICQKPNILKEFLNSLKHLNQKTISIDYFFIDDNKIEESSALLQNFMNEVSANKCRIIKNRVNSGDYVCNESTHCWNEDLVWKVANFKDLIIKKTIEDNYDYLFLIDSDILLNPNTIQHLVQTKKDIISEVFWTKWSADAQPLPQVWLYDTYTQYEIGIYENISNEEIYKRRNKFLDDMRKPGVYEVGGLGACTLLSKKALLAGVSFKRVKNITFWGEDRHFCVRATALGLKLFVDTHYPAYHIYRESDLAGTEQFKKDNNYYPKPKLTLSMCVKNEGKSKYFKEMLEEVKNYIDEAVIIDDASTDNTVAILKEVLTNVNLHIIHNQESQFSNEINLRKQQWEECIKTNPDWILVLDADEVPEKKWRDEIKELISKKDNNIYYFRLFDLWDEENYRDDIYWSAHNTYRPFLIKYNKDFNYLWNDKKQHCGRLPYNILSLPGEKSALRLKHYGWVDNKIRSYKYDRYKKLDPDCKFGWKEQYDSILDSNPKLTKWIE